VQTVLPPSMVDMFRTGTQLQLDWLTSIAGRTRTFMAKIPKVPRKMNSHALALFPEIMSPNDGTMD